MDFSLSEDQQAIAALASQILSDQSTNERQREVEKADGPRFDRELWSQVAKAGLLGVPVPEANGGAGLGFLEVAAILEHVGRHTAPIPILETLVLGALPLAEFGSEAQKAEWLPKVASGDAILTAALLGDALPRARSDGDDFSLSGSRLFVPAAAMADAVLVPAETDAGLCFFLVDPNADGVSREELLTTSAQPESKLVLDDVRIAATDLVGPAGAGERIAAWIELRAKSAACMVGLGACRAALDLTSDYIKTRKQFDQPIAMFQAVGHRAADAYVDTEAVTLTAWQAAWRIDAGLDAEQQVAVAKFYAA